MTTTASTTDIALMAHLMRRAGFGATREEAGGERRRTATRTSSSACLHPEGDGGRMPDDLIRRYHVDQSELRQLDGAGAYWMYQMITTSHPLEEKMALFWHGLFATGYAKLNQARALLNQIDMFKRVGFGSFRDILIELSKDPAMDHLARQQTTTTTARSTKTTAGSCLEALLHGHRQLLGGRHKRGVPRPSPAGRSRTPSTCPCAP